MGKRRLRRVSAIYPTPPKKKRARWIRYRRKKIQLAIGATHFEDCTPHFFSPSTLWRIVCQSISPCELNALFFPGYVVVGCGRNQESFILKLAPRGPGRSVPNAAHPARSSTIHVTAWFATLRSPTLPWSGSWFVRNSKEIIWVMRGYGELTQKCPKFC